MGGGLVPGWGHSPGGWGARIHWGNWRGRGAATGSAQQEQQLERILKRAALEEQPERDLLAREVVRRATASSAPDAAKRRMGTRELLARKVFRRAAALSAPDAAKRRMGTKDLLAPEVVRRAAASSAPDAARRRMGTAVRRAWSRSH